MNELQLSLAQMHRLGYAAVDLIAERSDDLSSRPVARRWTRVELERRLREPLPNGPVTRWR